ncbi:hypothetical protein PYW07_014264 [Mythimna separata]|uniref:Exonuclease 3'-5' domain-containing protein 2 n=1 Tax=Mythimna separata TaxID=271217 RepID=A0AAD7YZM3_MYTSE|nr:hypothetical protein PYW07_014264 [Mythimna separata]
METNKNLTNTPGISTQTTIALPIDIGSDDEMLSTNQQSPNDAYQQTDDREGHSSGTKILTRMEAFKLFKGKSKQLPLSERVVTTEESCDQVVEELRRRCQNHRALGFDCEWVTENGQRQPVALVQLSSFDGYCGLFRLSNIKVMPASLKDLLEDETIYKVGVAAADDGNYLNHDYSVLLKSTLDIRYLAELNGLEAGGLATLSSSLLDIVLDKSWRIRCSDWEAEELSESQVQYAAVDAHVAIRIFAILLEQLHRKQKGSSWLFGAHGCSVWSHLDEYCAKYADVQYKMKHVKLKDGAKEKDGRTKEPPLVPTKGYKLSMRAKPLYNNGYLEAPDGELLCRCDNKKALWFVNKELADVVNEEPFTVRLRFEPAGRAVGDVGRYYQLEKENKCVVCGSTNSYIRKNVVPREYRKMFPEIMKEHASHDVVLLCAQCHQLSNMRDHAMRERLADMCDAPLAANQRGNKYNEYAGSATSSATCATTPCASVWPTCATRRSPPTSAATSTMNTLGGKYSPLVQCHQLSNMRDHAMRERLADMCDAPLAANQRGNKYNEYAGRKMKAAARALLYQSHKLPEARRKELEHSLLQQFPDQDAITEEFLEKVVQTKLVLENSEFESHGDKVVDYFFKHGGLLRLEELWREHFLNSMEPRHMPALWSVKHTEEKLLVKWNDGRVNQEHLKSIGVTKLL